ncbi:hypothetical protein L596_020563 [Steinernema carpocapsae]|uniref:Cytochrome P450 n=1 Tax=Steinernema carpocapsae TaxID=34508 RepID=A0A4U5MU39_STECR|nr:hypothetical protein L596_020563 [Steinernema carpocapsae]
MVSVYVVVALVLFVLNWIRSSKRRDLPPGPTPLPILGNAHQLFWAFLNGKSQVEVFIEWKKKYGNVYTMYIGPYHCVIMADYKTTVNAFLKNGEDHAGRNFMMAFNGVRKNLGISFASGPGWLEQRRFSLRTLRNFGFGRNIMQERILEEFDYRCEKLDQQFEAIQGKHINMDPRGFTDLLVASIINRILVGYRYDEDHFDEVKKMKYGLDRQFDNLTIWDLGWLTEYTYKWPGFKQRWDVSSVHQEVMLEHMREAVETRRAEIKSGQHHLDYENGGDDYLDAYLIMYQKKKEKHEFLGWFSDENLACNLMDLWMAGNMTTMEALQWFLIFTLNDLPIQEKLREEAYGISNGNRQVELADRPNMPYTNAVVTEVLRCANILNFNLIHETTCKTMVGNYMVPKKVNVTAQLSVILNDESDFPNPGKFDPERYIKDKELIKHVIAFGIGKRSCVGESLARAELFLIIANFIQRYKYAPSESFGPPTKNELSTMLFMRRSRRFQMKLEKIL